MYVHAPIPEMRVERKRDSGGNLNAYLENVVAHMTPFKNKLFVSYAVKAALKKESSVPAVIQDCVTQALQQIPQVALPAAMPAPIPEAPTAWNAMVPPAPHMLLSSDRSPLAVAPQVGPPPLTMAPQATPPPQMATTPEPPRYVSTTTAALVSDAPQIVTSHAAEPPAQQGVQPAVLTPAPHSAPQVAEVAIQGGGFNRHQQWQQHLANALKRVVETPTSVPPEAMPEAEALLHGATTTMPPPPPESAAAREDVVVPDVAAPVVQEQKQRQKRKRFTTEETRNLYRGVKRHGEGHWTRILNDRSLSFDPSRTAGSLKDKWRNLKHAKADA